jgi:protein TonB
MLKYTLCLLLLLPLLVSAKPDSVILYESEDAPLFINEEGLEFEAIEKNPCTIEEYVDSKEIFIQVEETPGYLGGTSKMYAFISENLMYPKEAMVNGIQGYVYVEFMIDKSGDVRDAKVLHGIGHGCDEEAKRVVESMPDWSPVCKEENPYILDLRSLFNFGSLQKGLLVLAVIKSNSMHT